MIILLSLIYLTYMFNGMSFDINFNSHTKMLFLIMQKLIQLKRMPQE